MSLPDSKKELLRKFVGFTCERCHKPEDVVGKLEVHRINRGYKGGVYQIRNIIVCCKKCHKLYHSKEF